jgi:hypothetical protein
MAKLTKGFEFSPECIAALCTDVPIHSRLAILNSLDRNWDESETFGVEIEVPLREEPYAYFLRVKVDPTDRQVTIERSIS